MGLSNPETTRKSIRHLESLLKDDNIISTELGSPIAQKMKQLIKKYVDEVHKYAIQAPRKGTTKQLWRTKVTDDEGHRNNITSATEDGLYKKLYEYYGGGRESEVLEDLFVKAIKFKREIGLSDKSAAEYQRLWKNYYKDAVIAKKEITRIKPDEWYDFFWNMVKDNHMERKKFKQATIVANCIATYCIYKRILYTNPVRDIISNGDFPYVKAPAYTQIKAKSLTDIQVRKVVEWCEKEMKKPRTCKVYLYAIMFNIHAGLRIGELRGLTWDDIDLESGNVHVARQIVNTCTLQTDGDSLEFAYAGHKVLDHLKAFENERDIPIGEDLIELFEKVRTLNLPGKEVFPIRYHTYNDKIKKAASYAGINDLHQIRSHSLRTTAASNIYSKCHDVKTVQAFLGHTTPEMTSKYIKGQDSYNALRGLV